MYTNILEFENCEKLAFVTLPKGVTSIQDRAFKGCHSLTKIVIPDAVETIGISAFADCKDLTDVTISKNVAGIDAFAGTPWLEKLKQKDENGFIIVCGDLVKYEGVEEHVDIPDVVTSIGRFAFFGCSNLKSVIIPNTVTRIGDCAFEGCSSLIDVIILENAVGIDAFQDTPWLETQKDQNGFIIINGVLVRYEGTEKHVDIPEGVKTIGYNAFYGSDLTSITIPCSVTVIEPFAFQNCNSLGNVEIPEGVETIGYYAFSYSGLKSVTIPGSVNNVAGWAFGLCNNLKSVIISEGVKNIESNAFSYSTNLVSITIPKSLTAIDSFAFVECRRLTIYYNGTPEEWVGRFGDTYSDVMFINQAA